MRVAMAAYRRVVCRRDCQALAEKKNYSGFVVTTVTGMPRK